MEIAAAASALIEAAGRDLAIREQLARTGELGKSGYHPQMEAVHRDNVALLKTVLAEYGWPNAARFGVDAADAAWLVAQHAIGDPPLQRQALAALAALDEVEPWRVAMLQDRIAVFEGRPQRYGTQYDWDEAGQLSPNEIEDVANVDALRAAIGLEPLAHRTAALRAEAEREGQQPPIDLAKRRREFLEWAERAGWR